MLNVPTDKRKDASTSALSHFKYQTIKLSVLLTVAVVVAIPGTIIGTTVVCAYLCLWSASAEHLKEFVILRIHVIVIVPAVVSL